MKTIKELEGIRNTEQRQEIREHWTGRIIALKDVLGLIDELQRHGSNGLKKICYIDAEELKAWITG